jgi:pimeloyl-ACP methyl ester carboxylesterase
VIAVADTIPAARVRAARSAEPAGNVVLVHGTLDDSGSWRRVLDRLGDWHLTTYDRRGWGRSASAGPAGLAGDVVDLIGLLPDEPAILCGHSFGATVALAAAAEAPERVRAVVAYEPPLPWLPWWPERAPWERLVLDDNPDPGDAAEAMMREVLGAAAWDQLPARVREQRRADGPALVEEMRLGDAPPPFDPLDLGVPVLAAAGSLSLEHHILVSTRLADLVPSGRYREVPEAGHAAHVTHPDEFAALVDTAAELAQHHESRVGP